MRDRPEREWWRRIFNASYPRVFSYMEQYVEQDLAFLKDTLELRPGMTVLDMCCGYGRHSIPLALLGLRVTGVDCSAAQIREARRRAKACGAKVEWILGDGRTFRSRRRFDRVINMFTSFGYFEKEADDETMLGRMTDVLKPGGRLCLDIIHRDYYVRNFHPAMSMETDAGQVVDSNRLDFTTGRIETRRVVYGPRGPFRYTFSIRLYTAREVVLMAERAGLDVLNLYGTQDKRSISAEVPRLIMIASKP
jgi:ubiquinone/menaquinone biosynthesis C-methylase UbiE